MAKHGMDLLCELQEGEQEKVNHCDNLMKTPSDSVTGLVIPDQQRLHTSKVALPCRPYSDASVFG